MKNVNNNRHIRGKLHKMAFVLKSLEIENFKCFQKKQDISFEKITFLTGANSSGKSSIISAILGAIQSGEFPYKFSTNGKFVNMGDFSEISHKHSSNEISISLSFIQTNDKSNGIFKVETKWDMDKGNFLPKLKNLNFSYPGTLLSIEYKNGFYFLNFSYDPSKDPDYIPEKAKETQDNFMNRLLTSVAKEKFSSKANYEKQMSRYERLASSMYKKASLKNIKISDLDKIQEITSKKLNINLDYTIGHALQVISRDYIGNLNFISSFRHHPDRTYLEQSKDRLKIDKFGDGYLDQILLWEKHDIPRFQELNKIMRQLSLLDSISSHRIKGGRYEVTVKTQKGGTKTSLFDVGFGISQFLPVIVADLQLGRNSTLFVAEPEIHLHPSVQSKFGDYLVSQASNKKVNKNYIIETHSEYLLNKIRLAIVKGEYPEKEVSVYYLENDGKDVLIHDIKFTKSGKIEGAPKSFFDTYMMDLKDIAFSVKI